MLKVLILYNSKMWLDTGIPKRVDLYLKLFPVSSGALSLSTKADPRWGWGREQMIT